MMVRIAGNAASWDIRQYTVSAGDAVALDALLGDIASQYPSAEDPGFLSTSQLLAHSLPLGLRQFLTAAREFEDAPAYVISVPEIIGDIGHTPPNWWDVTQPTPTKRLEMALVLMAAILGDVFAWATQQSGRMVHDVVPIAGQEHEQLGSGSITPLSWHTEDAFHPFRADYVGLACLRNLDGVATTLLSVDQLGLSDAARACLSQDRFIILPDNSHRPEHNPGMSAEAGRFDVISEMLDNPQPVAALFGPKERQYMRADPDFMSAVPGDHEAVEALNDFFVAIENGLQDVVLEAGDFLFLDNYRCAHGRRSFTPRYDGRDRWLKRVNVSRDLRRARAAGACRGFRVMY